MERVVEIVDWAGVATGVLTSVFTDWTSVLTVAVKAPMALSRSCIETLAGLTGAEMLTRAAAAARARFGVGGLGSLLGGMAGEDGVRPVWSSPTLSE